MEENTENTIKEEYSAKPRSFYSFNLTEERIIFIFVSLIIFVALVLFSILIIFSKKNPDVNLSSSSENHSQLDDDISYSEMDEIIPGDMEPELTEEQIAAENMGSEEGASEEIAESEAGMQSEPEEESSAGEEGQDEGEAVFASEFYKKLRDKALEEQSFVPVVDNGENKETAKKDPVAAVKPTESTSTPTQSAKKDNNKKMYVIQIASYSDMANAEKVSSFYKNEGYPVYIKQKVKDSKTYYRLRIGPFTDQSKANEFLTRLKGSQYGKDSYISVGYY